MPSDDTHIAITAMQDTQCLPGSPERCKQGEIKARSSRRTRLILGLCIAAGLLGALHHLCVLRAPAAQPGAPHLQFQMWQLAWAMGTSGDGCLTSKRSVLRPFALAM